MLAYISVGGLRGVFPEALDNKKPRVADKVSALEPTTNSKPQVKAGMRGQQLPLK